MTATLSSIEMGTGAVLDTLHDAVGRLDPQLRRIVGYHFGWCDENGQRTEANGGKGIRARMTLLAAAAAGGDPVAAAPGAAAIELVHNFSLVHDDLMDRDTMRRHRRTVWSLWGDTAAILAGDAMLSLAHEILAEHPVGHADSAQLLLARTTRELIRGQILDVAFESRSDVTAAECLDMAAAKTAALLSAAAAMGGVYAAASPEVVAALSNFGRHVGVAFQIIDDLLGIWGDPHVTGKPVYSDLRSRKKTLPITWVIEHGGEHGQRVQRWLTDGHDPTEPDLRATAELVEAGGGRDWARRAARREAERAAQALDAIPELRLRASELIVLADRLVDREA
ncbi:polyprenyl synthetase family protein [Skermania sp. ID1734]|uniref:polyprenyl synthetase family protein n=1 Tax=Skermania sp. ID1734 TaxID=2597516 RepID=UPI00117BFECE|nr:polyprenyl synthetase family protein [Skermania sp. ID1734]TSE00329.1 polyprenyl synthetase family protein [Skermania sp. ID1734]